MKKTIYTFLISTIFIKQIKADRLLTHQENASIKINENTTTQPLRNNQNIGITEWIKNINNSKTSLFSFGNLLIGYFYLSDEEFAQQFGHQIML